MDLKETQALVDGLVSESLNAADALESIIEIGKQVPDMPGLCKPKVVLLTQPACLHCKDFKILYREYLAEGSIVELDIRQGEGGAIAELNNIDGTPSLLVLDCENNLIGEVFRDEELTPL